MDLAAFELGGMLRCGLELRRSSRDAATMEQAANAIVGYLRTAFTSPDGTPQCKLVRFYKTHRYAALDRALQSFASGLLPAEVEPTDDLRCLTLLATAGDEPAWNSRHSSRGHRAIPLPSEDFVERAPMIAQLIRSFGMSIPEAINPPAASLTLNDGRSYNVFYVRRARGSPYIPAQDDFVVPYEIASVVGFGGRLDEELFAIIMFCGVEVPQSSATRFRTIALDAKTAIYKFRETEVFDPASAADKTRPTWNSPNSA